MSIPKVSANPAGFSTATKIGIGLGAVAIVALGFYLYASRKCPNFRIISSTGKNPTENKTSVIASNKFIYETLDTGSMEEIKNLIDNGTIDPSDPQYIGHLLTCEKLRPDRDSIILLFINHLDAVNIEIYGKPFIVIAASQRLKQTVVRLINKHPDQAIPLKSRDKFILYIIQNNWIDIFKSLSYKLVNAENAKALFSQALTLGRDNIARYLTNYVPGSDVTECLALAAEKENQAMVNELMDKRPNVDVKLPTTATPLMHFVIQKNWLDTLKKFPTKFLQERVDSKSLDYAIVNQNDEMAAFLVQHMGDVNISIRGESLVERAASKELTQTLELLLDKGADAKVSLPYLKPPIHKVVEKGWFNILKKMPMSVLEESFIGQTPLQLALQRGADECAACLIEKGADLNKKHKSTPIKDLVSLPNMPKTMQVLKERSQTLSETNPEASSQKSPVDDRLVNLEETESHCPLHGAIENRDLESIQALAEKPEMINNEEDGKTPLEHFFDQYSSLPDEKTLSALIRAGARCKTFQATAEKLVDINYWKHLVLFINTQEEQDLTPVIQYIVSNMKDENEEACAQMALGSLDANKVRLTPFSDDALYINYGLAEKKPLSADDANRFIEKWKNEKSKAWEHFLSMQLEKVDSDVANQVPFTFLSRKIDRVLVQKKSIIQAEDVNQFQLLPWIFHRNTALEKLDTTELPKVKFVKFDNVFVTKLVDKGKTATIEDIRALKRLQAYDVFRSYKGKIAPIDNPPLTIFDEFDDTTCVTILRFATSLTKEHFDQAKGDASKTAALHNLANQKAISVDDLADMYAQSELKWKDTHFGIAYNALVSNPTAADVNQCLENKWMLFAQKALEKLPESDIQKIAFCKDDSWIKALAKKGKKATVEDLKRLNSFGKAQLFFDHKGKMTPLDAEALAQLLDEFDDELCDKVILKTLDEKRTLPLSLFCSALKKGKYNAAKQIYTEIILFQKKIFSDQEKADVQAAIDNLDLEQQENFNIMVALFRPEAELLNRFT